MKHQTMFFTAEAT